MVDDQNMPIEFELEHDEDDDARRLPHASAIMEIVRKSFRIPVDTDESLHVFVDDREFRVFDISEGGVGLELPSPTTFAVGDGVDRLRLCFADQEMTLRGRVAHVSEVRKKEFICGIQYLDLDADLTSYLARYVNSRRESLFKPE